MRKPEAGKQVAYIAFISAPEIVQPLHVPFGRNQAQRRIGVEGIDDAGGAFRCKQTVDYFIAPLVTIMAVKEAVNRANETSLREGLLFERRSFHALFATEDQKEGMAAFLEKREAQFRDR